MLGGKPRQQAIGHVIGIFAGAIACVPLFFLLFLPPDANGVRSTAAHGVGPVRVSGSAAVEGRGRHHRQGLQRLCPIRRSCRWSWRAASAAAIEIARIVTKGRFPLSSVSIGLGVVLPPEATFAMFVGALVFWLMGRRYPDQGHPRARVLGRRPGADLRRADLGCRADGHRQRDRQCADELK